MATFIQGNGEPVTQPSPNYPQQVESCGERTKNLYDFDITNLSRVPYNATTTRWGYDLGVLPAGDYTIHFELSNADEFPAYTYLRQKTTSNVFSNVGIFTTETLRNNLVDFTANGTSNYYFVFASGSVSSETSAINQRNKFKYIQLEVGTEATDYEPYGYKVPVKVNETTTNIYLTEPLRRVGEFFDYIDYKNKKVVRNVKDFRPNGSEDWTTGQSSGYNRYQYLLSDAVKGNKSASLCNIFRWVSGNAEDNTFVIGSNTLYLYVRYDSVADVTEWKEFLSNNNLEVVYPLATPTEEPIDIPTINTFDGTNTVEIQTQIEPSGMSLTYWRQILPYEIEETDNIIQDGSNILIISTGAEITQSGTNLLIGG